jgi:hypothetical protein
VNPLPRRSAASAGYTMVELVVTMSIFMVVVALMMAAVTTLSSTLRKTTNLADATTSSRNTFNRLDRQLRYATAINRPTQVGNDWYIEFSALNDGGVDLCHQWRLVSATDKLQQRAWTAGTTTTPTWSTVTTGVTNDPTTLPPFTFVKATTASTYQGVSVTLKIINGSLNPSTVTTTSALQGRNTSVETVTNADDNSDGASDNPVCTTFGRS